jgi:hypothetical protein
MMGRTRGFFVSAAVAVLLVSLFFTASPQVTKVPFVKASPILPFGAAEYLNGTISSSNSPLDIWYDWVNISGTQIINYAMYTTPEWNYSVPIANLVG